jgi:gamma-glutamylcyclotransferase (GGCT)/AIG2-like uncharacterized protein YtfP
MDPDALLPALNQHPHLCRLGTVPLDELAFTAAEKAFLRAHRPEQVLVVYGTLAPGRANHAVIAPVRGTWQPGLIHGTLRHEGWAADLGYPGFVHAPQAAQRPIEVVVLSSAELGAHWPRLDAFEGPGYRRLLTPYALTTGEAGVGFIYALNKQQELRT